MHRDRPFPILSWKPFLQLAEVAGAGALSGHAVVRLDLLLRGAPSSDLPVSVNVAKNASSWHHMPKASMTEVRELLEGQSQKHSTAVTALVRVAAHHGLTVYAEQLSRSNPFDTEEPGIPLLIKMAEGVGLRGTLTRLKRGGLAKIVPLLPAILLLPNGKAALLTRVEQMDGAGVALIDELESEQPVTVLYDEPRLFEFWTGDIIVFKLRWRLGGMERPFGFRWLVDQLLIERRLFRDIGIAALFMSVLALIPPITVMVLVDRVLTYQSMSTLQVMGGLIVGVIAFETLFGYLRRYLIWVATSRIDGRLNLYTFDKLLNLPMSFFERVPTGMINAKLSQIGHIREFLTGQLFGTLLDSINLFVLVPVLFILSWKVASVVMLLALSILGVYIVFLPALRRRYGAVIWAEQRMASHQVETIYGIRTVKGLSLDGLKRRQRDQRVAEAVEAHQNFDRFANIPQTLVMPLERLIYSGSFFLGAYLALTSPTSFTIGSVMAFAMLSARVAGPIAHLAGTLNSFEYARGALAEVASVMNVPAEEGRSGNGLKLPIKGNVVFHDVRFRYTPTASYALNGVSFEIPLGSIIGVMGRSGSGKTTVARLLQGLNRDYEGLIKIDGMDLRDIDLDHLRSNVGIVPQENFLFSGTIRENISAARPKSSFAKVVQVAQLAGAEEFIERMPHGYETYVEEGAANFSGGQRQRLAIARALLIDPPILVFDEATSALDAESEAIVNDNLIRIARNRTVVIISHRLSALVVADAILVLERGRLYDAGPHHELIERCDIYRSLWSQQNRHLELEGRNASRATQPSQAV
jgi:subfamily B ATP-binding cassette protein HlyB/CyaB